MSKIAVLVVTYNRKDLLRMNLLAMQKQTYTEWELYICDNSSTDGTEQMIAEEFCEDKRIQYYNTGSNLGGAGGFSYGLNMILPKAYEYTWIMDDDAVPEADALERIVDAAAYLGPERFGFLSSNVLWKDGTTCMMNRVIVKKDVQIDKREFHLIGNASFVGCLINNRLARELGLPIAEFYIYMDDTEYTLRLGDVLPGYWIEESKIIHHMAVNESSGIETAPEDRLSRYRYAYRNRIFCYRKRWKMSWIKVILLYMMEIGRVCVYSKTNRWTRIKIIVKGFFEGLHFKPEIQKVDL